MNIERYYNSELKPFALSKPVKIIDNKHLDWIRDRPCVVTKSTGRNDAHHVQYKSDIQNDLLSVPLRHDIHMRGHSEGWAKVESEFGVDIKDALIATLVERILFLEAQNGRKGIFECFK